MSAFLCNDFHISYIVEAGIKYRAWVNLGGEYRYLNLTDRQNIFEILKRENIRSINYRYNETSEESKNIGFPFRVFSIDPIRALKAIACLEYQSCEHPQWKTSLAFKLCRSIEAKIIRNLPGYDEAPWELPEPSLNKKAV